MGEIPGNQVKVGIKKESAVKQKRRGAAALRVPRKLEIVQREIRDALHLNRGGDEFFNGSTMELHDLAVGMA